jgi:hypothetical protein
MEEQPSGKTIARPERREFHRKKFQGKLEMEWGSSILGGTLRDVGLAAYLSKLRPRFGSGPHFGPAFS